MQVTEAVIVHDAAWWLLRISLVSGGITLFTILWKPLSKRWKKDFDESVFDTLARDQKQIDRVKYIVKEVIFPKEVAERQRLIERLEVAEDRIIATEAMMKAHAQSLQEISSLARQMQDLPTAIKDLSTTMWAIQREVSEMRGEIRAWDGQERRTKQR